MKTKKIIALAILISCLFAISAVSAADNQTEDFASADLTSDDVSSYALESDDVSSIGDDTNSMLVGESDDVALSKVVVNDEDFRVEVRNVTTGEEYNYVASIVNVGEKSGNISISLNGTEVYNKNMTSWHDSIYLSQYGKSFPWDEVYIYSFISKNILKYGTHNIKVNYIADGETKLLYDGLVDINYYFHINDWEYDDNFNNWAIFYDNLVLKLLFPDDATGNLTVDYNGKTKVISYNRGRATCILPASEFTIGTHKITFTLKDDEKYPSKSYDYNVFVCPKVDVPEVMSVGENDMIVLEFPQNFTGNVDIYNATYVEEEVDYGEYTDFEEYYVVNQLIGKVSIMDGKAIIPLTFLDVGFNSIFINCSGDGSYENYFDVEVIKNNEKINVSLESNAIVLGDGAVLKITAPRSSNSVSIYVDGELYKEISLSNGEISEYISNLAIGEHKIKVLYADYDEYYGRYTYLYSNNFPLTVTEKPKATKLTAGEVTLDYGAVGFLIAYLNDSLGVPISDVNVTVEIDNVLNVLNTDENGMVNLTIDGLSPGNHVVLIKFDGNEKLLASSITTNVVVNKINSRLTVSDVNTVYNGGKYLIITLNDVEGKAINGAELTVVLGGKTYTPTTKNGQVKISTNGLVPVKTYVATIKFDGDTKYDKSNTTAKVVVKKATPKLTAKAKTFKKSVKIKKYTVTLKTNQNKVMKNTKLTLKVNGKTYSAKTNAKGQATFKITKLTKKGKFNAVVTYKGNAYYNKLSKKVQIKIN